MLVQRDIAFDGVQIGVAESADMDLDADLAWTWLRRCNFTQGERRCFSGPRLVKNHGAHSDIVGDRFGDRARMFDETSDLPGLSLKR